MRHLYARCSPSLCFSLGSLQFSRLAGACYAVLSDTMALDIQPNVRDVLRETFRRIGTEFLHSTTAKLEGDSQEDERASTPENGDSTPEVEQ